MHSFPNVSPTIQHGARSKSSMISVPHGAAARRTVTPSAPSCQKRGGLAIAPTCSGEGDRRRPGISSVQPVFRTQKRVPRLPNRLVFDSRGRFSRQPPPAGCDRRPSSSSRLRPVPDPFDRRIRRPPPFGRLWQALVLSRRPRSAIPPSNQCRAAPHHSQTHSTPSAAGQGQCPTSPTAREANRHDAPHLFSNRPAALASSRTMPMRWGHTPSHTPHAMHEDAGPAEAFQS